MPVPERQRGKELAWRAGADRGVVLQRDDLLQEFLVVRSEPREAESRQAVALAHRAKTQCSIVEIARRWQPRGGIVFEFPVDLVCKNVNVVPRSQFHHAAEGLQWHQQPGRIVRCVDVERPGVWANHRLKRGDVVGPAFLSLSAPLADGCASTLWQGER